MDAETLGRAVEPFFSTKGIGRGTGLGLSMVHGLASQLGGALLIESVPQAGTTVQLLLPVSEEPVAPRPEAPAETVRGAGLVLLVDDEEGVRATASQILEELGYRVVEAASATSSLDSLENGLVPDLLLSDQLMPGMTGTQLGRLALERLPALQVVIMSGYADLSTLSTDFEHLPKPFLASDLAAALHRAAATASPSAAKGM